MSYNKKELSQNQIIRILPIRLRTVIAKVFENCFDSLHEIVLRTERPVCVYKNGVQYFLCENGCLTQNYASQPLVVLTACEITECFNYACGYSVYSHISEIKEGFVTVNGGHRVGFSGTAVLNNGEITNIRDITTISVRISREIIGCGDKLGAMIQKSSKGVLICGAPCSGKTTVLRDIARILSSVYLRRTCIIDTKSELGASYKGVLQNDLGMCDVLDGYPRNLGIGQAVRLLSPEYIICDEIGCDSDVKAILDGVNSGVTFVASMHAGSVDELNMKRYFMDILATGAFEKIAFLGGRENPGEVIQLIESEELKIA